MTWLANTRAVLSRAIDAHLQRDCADDQGAAPAWAESAALAIWMDSAELASFEIAALDPGPAVSLVLDRWIAQRDLELGVA
jgi:hypothetical protein